MNKVHNASQPQGSKPNGTPQPLYKKRLMHYAAFAFLVISSFFEMNWVWGLLFIGWTIPAYFNRVIFFIDLIERDKEPVFFWLIFIIWILFGALQIAGDIPALQPYLS